jgi:hypothetical protein
VLRGLQWSLTPVALTKRSNTGSILLLCWRRFVRLLVCIATAKGQIKGLQVPAAVCTAVCDGCTWYSTCLLHSKHLLQLLPSSCCSHLNACTAADGFLPVFAVMYVVFAVLQRTAAEQVLKTFQENPDAWTRVDTILEKGKTQQTKFFALQVIFTQRLCEELLHNGSSAGCFYWQRALHCLRHGNSSGMRSNSSSVQQGSQRSHWASVSQQQTDIAQQWWQGYCTLKQRAACGTSGIAASSSDGPCTASMLAKANSASSSCCR